MAVVNAVAYETCAATIKVGAILACMWFAPQVIAGTHSPCSAIVKQAAPTPAMVEPKLATAISEAILSLAMSERYPGVDPQLSCVGRFWSELTG